MSRPGNRPTADCLLRKGPFLKRSALSELTAGRMGGRIFRAGDLNSTRRVRRSLCTSIGLSPGGRGKSRISTINRNISRRDLDSTKRVWRPLCTATGPNPMQKSEFNKPSTAIRPISGGRGNSMWRDTNSTERIQHPLCAAFGPIAIQIWGREQIPLSAQGGTNSTGRVCHPPCTTLGPEKEIEKQNWFSLMVLSCEARQLPTEAIFSSIPTKHYNARTTMSERSESQCTCQSTGCQCTCLSTLWPRAPTTSPMLPSKEAPSVPAECPICGGPPLRPLVPYRRKRRLVA